MGRTLHVEIYDRSRGTRTVQACELPFEIGKQPQSASCIRLDPSYVTISRVHGKVEEAESGLIYIDSSSNGTTISGTFVKGRNRAISSADIIIIENYEIKILETKSALIKQTGPTLQVRGEQEAEPGDALVIVKTDDALKVMLDTPESNQHSVVGRIHFDGVAVTFDLYGHDASMPITVNKRLVSDMPLTARMSDVVEIGGERFEVLGRDQKKIVCGNPSCHLLNDLPFEGNCVWCGHYLAASGSFTRVTLP